jgi:hypothetical protein
MKMPISSLLYILSTGLFGGSALLFYQTVTAPKARDDKQIEKEVLDLLNQGRAGEPPDRQEVYGGEYWRGLVEVNWTGKEPPKPETPEKDGGKKELEAPPVVAIDQILTVLFLLSGGDDTRVWVRYKPTANVQPPEPPAAAPGTTVYGGPTDTSGTRPATPAGVPATGQPQPARPAVTPTPIPAALDPNARLLHMLRLDEPLWPPYAHIRLVRVAEDGESVFFVHGEKDKPREQWREESVLRNTLDLDPKVLEALHLERAAAAERDKKQRAAAQAPAGQTPAGESKWIDPPETTEVSTGQFHVSRKDDDYLRDNMQRLLEDTPTREYRSPRGNVAGISIGEVRNPTLVRMGVQSGDVLLSLNGQPTPTRADAIKVAKDQYNRGVREFSAEIMRAGRVVTQTYHAKK